MHETDLIVKKRCTWLTVLKVVLVLAAVAFVAYKVYEKFFAKKNDALALEADEAELDELAPTEEPSEEPASLEVAAEEVIANPESMA